MAPFLISPDICCSSTSVMRGGQTKLVLPAHPLSHASLGVVILRDSLFMLKMLKSGFVSFGEGKSSPNVPHLVPLLDYQASWEGKPISIPPRTVSWDSLKASVYTLLKA